MSANKLAGKYVLRSVPSLIDPSDMFHRHALGARARKASQGILTVRFEMPFAIWCSSCPVPTIIGQGVRFNAEKKRVGNYFSTPIYSFRMKHAVCGGAIEIRTDPKNTAYEVTAGAKKRDTGEDKDVEGAISVMTEEERERIRNDAFAALEGKVEDKKRALNESTRVEELQRQAERDWKDPYADNRRLRRAFRQGRKVREREAEAAERLKDKMGLGIELLDEREEDRLRAGFVEFGSLGSDGRAVEMARARPLFSTMTDHGAHASTENWKISKRTRSKTAKESLKRDADGARAQLAREIRGNSRAAVDPFLHADTEGRRGGALQRGILGVKRTRNDKIKAKGKAVESVETNNSNGDSSSKDDHHPAETGNTSSTGPSLGLVDYDSD